MWDEWYVRINTIHHIEKGEKLLADLLTVILNFTVPCGVVIGDNGGWRIHYVWIYTLINYIEHTFFNGSNVRFKSNIEPREYAISNTAWDLQRVIPFREVVRIGRRSYFKQICALSVRPKSTKLQDFVNFLTFSWT